LSIDEYVQLIRDFLSGAIPAPDFETRYLSAMKSQERDLGREVFFILQDLFDDVDAYTHFWPSPPDLNHVISEDELRQEAQIALDALEKLDAAGDNTSTELGTD